jgi:hypothetical protein
MDGGGDAGGDAAVTKPPRAIKIAWDYCINEHGWDDPCGTCVGIAQSIAAEVERAVREENEACAQIAEGQWHPESNSLSERYLTHQWIARDIRARTRPRWHPAQ